MRYRSTGDVSPPQPGDFYLTYPPDECIEHTVAYVPGDGIWYAPNDPRVILEPVPEEAEREETRS